MFKDNNERVNELLEEFGLETYDMVAQPGFNSATLLGNNSKILDDILSELISELRNQKIEVITKDNNNNHEQSESGDSSGNTRRNR